MFITKQLVSFLSSDRILFQLILFTFLFVSVVSRGRALHAAQAANSTIDRQLDAKLAWIGDCERCVDKYVFK